LEQAYQAAATAGSDGAANKIKTKVYEMLKT
jgi:hypothetical protein